MLIQAGCIGWSSYRNLLMSYTACVPANVIERTSMSLQPDILRLFFVFSRSGITCVDCQVSKLENKITQKGLTIS